MCAEAKSAAGFQNLLAGAALMARHQIEWAAVTTSTECMAFFSFVVPIFNYSGKLPNSGFHTRGDGRFQKKKKKKEEKWKKSCNFFFFVCIINIIIPDFWAECCQKYALSQKKLQIKFFLASNFGQKSREGVYPFPPGVELGGSKDDMAEILNCTEMENEKKFPNNFYLKLSLE